MQRYGGCFLSSPGFAERGDKHHLYVEVYTNPVSIKIHTCQCVIIANICSIL